MTYDTDFAAIMAAIDCTADMIRADLGVITEKLPELRRQALADPRRRNRDAKRYALGGALTVLGFERIDPIAITGLLGNPRRMLTWLVDARAVIGDAPLADLVDAVFEHADRYDWCRQWGVHIDWLHGKALYDAAVTSFVTSGRTGANERWRRDTITADQEQLISRICTWRQITEPKVTTRGEAFDWIYAAGGNPTWWGPPATPADWID
ncbi:MAG: hypothetical protein J0I47_06225 [Sphingomonas sp.]|uniref:hypothetical protein n=1 Tax=Sphingomonas sp. TaxID=28214 RepID=UPI001ACC833D|nr:hypothetical protein [Sphingomonas sp.]MBN8807816.1 hypothetical protein [Sphingomonas sp.]